MNTKTLIIVYSYHHMNTLKIAKAMAEEVNCEVLDLSLVDTSTLEDYNLIGFGSGIDSGKHYPELIEFVQNLPKTTKLKAFTFSTSATIGDDKVIEDHSALTSILNNKGYNVLNHFACKGYNTNSFLKLLGGMNKNRPNEQDLEDARIFIKNTLENV